MPRKPCEPEELQIHSDGLGFAIFTDIQQRRQWSLSTNERDFLTAYAAILSQFVQTSAGRVLINQLMTGREIIVPDRIHQRMDDILSEIFDKIREREEAAEREDPACPSGNTRSCTTSWSARGRAFLSPYPLGWDDSSPV